MTGFTKWSGTAYCLFMATIVSTKTITSLRLRANFKPYIFKLESLQLNRIKFLRKSYQRVGKAFVLNNPLYNLKICDYFSRNSMSGNASAVRRLCPIWTKVVFHTENAAHPRCILFIYLFTN